MHNFFRYFGLTVFALIGLAIAGLAWGVLSLRAIVTEQFSSMSLEAYTCADFRREVQESNGPALRPLVAAVMAYGIGTESIEQLEANFQRTGIIPAVSKVYQLCEANPQTPLLRLFANQTVAPSVPSKAADSAAPVPPATSLEVPAPELPPSSTVIPQNREETL